MDSDLSDQENGALFRMPRPRVIRLRPNHFDEWDDKDFYDRFRMSKQSSYLVLEQIQEKIRHNTKWNNAVSAETMFLLTLRFYATGGFLISVGDFGRVSKSTMCRIIKKVTVAICSLRPKYIKFYQNENELQQRMVEFYEIANFPRVIAALDCTHVRIQSPGGEMAEVFRNRKRYFSINVQAMCDANLKFLDLVARWPGSCHDSTIFSNSRICARFESGEFGNKVVVADGGYPSKSFLMTPLRNSATNAEIIYNKAQISTRNPIERLFGVWKRRFPVLAIGARLKIQTIQCIVSATAILHNICCSQNEHEVPYVDAETMALIDQTVVDDNPQNFGRENHNTCNESREAFIRYFQQMQEDE